MRFRTGRIRLRHNNVFFLKPKCVGKCDRGPAINVCRDHFATDCRVLKTAMLLPTAPNTSRSVLSCCQKVLNLSTSCEKAF